jgi:metal-responsive CopG/Arc/MetJ family transcriptional regulator
MSTINISLPKKQIDYIDKLADSYGFANRSEFIRSLIRFITYKPKLLNQSAVFPFISPEEKSVEKIMAGFKKNKKYSPDFLKDLKQGLQSSNYFKK